MAEIKTFPLLRHLRAEPTSHVLRYRRGALHRDGAGLAFWFRAIDTAVAEVPVDDRELPFLFHARSADFQQLTVQGVITFRIADPPRTARRFDFAIDLDTGRWTQAPLEQVAGLLTQLAQQFVIDELVKLDVRTILTDGVAPIRSRIATGLAGEAALADLGLEIVAVRVAAVAPTAELEKALQQPTRESIQQRADEATFQRRALAVESERAIADNELQTRIELARREEELVAQDGANARRRAEEQAAAQLVDAQASDERAALHATREAQTIEALETARLRAEAERARIQTAIPANTLLALGLQQLAGQIGQVEHLTITPDLFTRLLAQVTDAAEAA
ncbi:MAG TPA: SPFH domain-containing protein [Solirubrobacteraceae bacterium]|nr:SPFH domain-containing protein [Solirubrobacteraceae bacterium]